MMRDAAAGTVSGTGGVLYAAFTGKAALVMSRKGTPASTIHSLIYRVSEATQILRGEEREAGGHAFQLGRTEGLGGVLDQGNGDGRTSGRPGRRRGIPASMT